MYRKKRRLLSMLLAMAVLLAGNGITSFAWTVSENGVMVEEGAMQDNDDPVEREEAVSEQPDEISNEEQEVIIGGDVSESSVRGAAGTPKAPVHHCTKDITNHYCSNDSTVWSYLYFGSYPQSEVTDSRIIESIEEAIATEGIETDSEGICDVWVDGTKYRKMSTYRTRYFKWERIKWKVLQNDGETLFVLAETALDCKRFYESYSYVKWENSTIRSWLNDSFYNTAFNSNEQKAIVEQDTTVGSESTHDLVYLMSVAEMGDKTYGFCGNDSSYVQSLMLKASAYGIARGISTYNDANNCYWWLRTPSNSYGNAMAYDYNGSYSQYHSVNNGYYGVRPALHIDLSSKMWLLTDEPIGGEDSVPTEVEAPSGPFHHCSATGAIVDDRTDWDYIYFGNYPQTEITDSTTIAAIESAISESGVEANAGIDVVVDGTKYRRISKRDTNYDRYFGNDDYRYFKWEKIKWKVLENNGNTLFVVADNAVDCKNYNDPLTKATWEDSTLRSWLNDSFYNEAFTDDEQKAITEQNVVNENNPIYDTEGGKDTKDKLYLLSIGEGMNGDYGFCSEFCNYSLSREVMASDYAWIRGTYRDRGNKCVWWLRSPGRAVNNVAVISNNGNVHQEGNNIASPSNVGVCPALHIKLESKAWFMADGSTGGDEGDDPNPDNPDKPNPDNPDPDNPDPDKPNPDNPDPDNPDPDKPNPDNPDPDNPDPDKPNPDNPTPDNPDPDKPNPDNPTPDNPKPGDGKEDGNKGDTNLKNDVIPVKVTSLAISAPSKKLAAGQKVKLTLAVSPVNATNQKVTWTTSNTKYATVDENGKVSLKAAGAGKNVTITATANDGSGKKATIKIKVMKHKVKSIKLKASSKTVKAGKSIKLGATVKTTGKSVNKTLKWSSSNTKYATVNKSGKVTAKKAGKGKTVTITAASTDGTNKKAKVKIKIK